MGAIFGRFDVDDSAQTVPYAKRVIRDVTLRMHNIRRPRRTHAPGLRFLLLRIAAFAYFAFAAWTALDYLIRELG